MSTNTKGELNPSKLREIARELDLNPYEEVAEITAVNATPWWGGDYETKTHDPQTKNLSALPTTESIKGAMLWILRQIMQNTLGKEIEIEKANKQLAKYLGGRTNGEATDSLIRIEIMEAKELKKETDSKAIYDYLKSVSDAWRRELEPQGSLNKMIEILENLANECLTSIATKVAKSDVAKVRNVSIPREELTRNLVNELSRVTLEMLGYLSFCLPSFRSNCTLCRNIGDLKEYFKGEGSGSIRRVFEDLLNREIEKILGREGFSRLRRELRSTIRGKFKNRSQGAIKHLLNSNLLIKIHANPKDMEYNEISVRLGRSKININKHNGALFKLFTIPRVKLLMMNAKSIEEIYAKIPALSNSIELKVKVYVRKSANVNTEALARLAVSTLVYALQVHGLGKAVSRGFGRFNIKEIRFSNIVSRQSDYVSNIEKIINALSGEKRAGELNLEKTIEKLIKLISSDLHELKLLGQGIRGSRYVIDVKIVGKESGGIIHPLAKPLRLLAGRVREYGARVKVIDEIEALSAIGYATLKSIWKVIVERVNVKAHGAFLNTWILGLPRWQQKIHAGYAYKIKASGREEFNGDVRRLSTIFLYPVRASSNKYYVIMIKYKTYMDHCIYVMGMGGRESGKLLYHKGRYGSIEVRDIVMRERISCPESIDHVYKEAEDHIANLLEGRCRAYGQAK